MKPTPCTVEINSLSMFSSLASSFMAVICVANISYCSSRMLVTFSWKSKNYSFLSYFMVSFMMRTSSRALLRLFRISYDSISYSISSLSFSLYFYFCLSLQRSFCASFDMLLLTASFLLREPLRYCSFG
jgi:hypothetical protein